MHEDDDPVLCPIFQFLAIAFADQAFAANDSQSVDQLDNERVSPSSLPDFSFFIGTNRCKMFLCFVNPFKLPKEYGPRQMVRGHMKTFTPP